MSVTLFACPFADPVQRRREVGLTITAGKGVVIAEVVTAVSVATDHADAVAVDAVAVAVAVDVAAAAVVDTDDDDDE